MRLFTGVKPIELTFGRDIGDHIDDLAVARVVKAIDGMEAFRSVSVAIDSLEPAAIDFVYGWIKKNRGFVFRRSGGNVGTKPGMRTIWIGGGSLDTSAMVLVVAFGKKGVIKFARSAFSSNGPRRVRRGSKSAEQKVLQPRRVSVSAEISGADTWVLEAKEEIAAGLREYKKVVKTQRKQAARKMHMLAFGKRGPLLKAIASFEENLERSNYTDEVLTKYDHAVEQLQSRDPKGRLLVVHGPPGVGKTFMLRALVSAMKGTKNILVPPQFVKHFSEPTLGAFLMRQKRPVLFIEDADMLIMERGVDNMTSINSMLNLADGMFGAVADVRIVCTTNVENHVGTAGFGKDPGSSKIPFKMDAAIERKGRLIDLIHVGRLPTDRANERLLELNPLCQARPFIRPTALSDVYDTASGVSG